MVNCKLYSTGSILTCLKVKKSKRLLDHLNISKLCDPIYENKFSVSFWAFHYDETYIFLCSKEGKVELKCSAILGDFFMRSETVTLQDKRTNVRMVEVKSDKSEKLLGLFEDNSYREEEIFLTRTSSGGSIYTHTATTNFLIFPLILTLLLNFCQFTET